MIKNILVGLIFISPFLSSSLLAILPTAALPTANLGIGYVDFDRAIGQEAEPQKYISELQAEENRIIAAEQKAKTEIEAEATKLQAALTDPNSKLDVKAKQAQQLAFSNKINDLQQKFTEQRNKLEQDRKVKERDVQEKNQLLLKNIAQARGHRLILDLKWIAYIDDEERQKNDVTDDLHKKYNATYTLKPDPKKATPKGKAKGK